MDQYSQQHLKVAATEPEHVVRKAELDAALGSLPGGGSSERLGDLATVDKTSLVGAVNEIFYDLMDSRETLAQVFGGVEFATFAKLVAIAQQAKNDLAANLTAMGVLGIADEPILELAAKILQIPNRIVVGSNAQQILYRDKLQAWCPFRPFPGVFTRTGVQPETLYSSGGGNATGGIVNAEWNPNVGVKFQESWTRNNVSSGALSLAGNRTNTIWWRPYTWPENMSIIRYGNGEGYSGSGLKVKNGRLMIMAEVLYTQDYNPNYNWDDPNDDYYVYEDHSTYVDLGPFNSETFPPDTWHMIAVKARTLEYYDSYNGYDRTRTVYDYWLDGISVTIPYRTTGIWNNYDYYEAYPNAGGPEYIHLGSRVWSYGEPPDLRNPPNYSGWFLDWRGYDSLDAAEIAALYAIGPYQI